MEHAAESGVRPASTAYSCFWKERNQHDSLGPHLVLPMNRNHSSGSKDCCYPNLTPGATSWAVRDSNFKPSFHSASCVGRLQATVKVPFCCACWTCHSIRICQVCPRVICILFLFIRARFQRGQLGPPYLTWLNEAEVSDPSI